MNQKKVSIVIPVYNGEKNIEATLNNILRSTHRELEVIIVDDGSSDGSVALCRQLQKQDSRIVIYEKKNGGIASTRNYGVERATGDFLCFCDHDDIVQSETYQRMVERMEHDGSDMCLCSTGRSIDGKKSLFEQCEDATYRGEEILENVLYPLLFKGYNPPIKVGTISRYPNIWNCMFRMEFWKKYNFVFRAYVNFEDDLLVKIDSITCATGISTISYAGYFWNVNLKSETYAHKFVENLAEKQQLCYEDIENCVKRCVTDQEVLAIIKQIIMCKQYLDAIHILTSPQKKKNISFIKEFCNQTIYARAFDECIVARRYVAQGQIRAMVLLPLLEKKMSLVSYFAEKILDYVLWLSLHSQILTKLERIIKGISPSHQD